MKTSSELATLYFGWQKLPIRSTQQRQDLQSVPLHLPTLQTGNKNMPEDGGYARNTPKETVSLFCLLTNMSAEYVREYVENRKKKRSRFLVFDVPI